MSRQPKVRAALIIAAGGSGSRFQASLKRPASAKPASKLFYDLDGEPVLARTISLFQNIPGVIETVVALPAEAVPAMKTAARARAWKKIKFIAGGRTRAESVLKALRQASASAKWVMVHDGARPLTRREAVEKLLASGASSDGVILARKVVPTLKEADETGRILRTVDRRGLFEAETPQLVRRDLLEKAYRQVPQALEATDEASLLEAVRGKVKVILHDGWNPKITTAADLELAQAWLAGAGEVRTGFGRDTHRLVTGRPFYLGGYEIKHDRGPLGHSDGDALLHAVADAVLGAIGAGDIGDWFSDREARFKNMRSEKFIQAVLLEAGKRGFKLQHVDTVVILEAPKLGPVKELIRKNMARLMSLKNDQVSVKAKTAEGLGPEGAGLAITCEAVVTVKGKARP